jgi:hypothetical protein
MSLYRNDNGGSVSIDSHRTTERLTASDLTKTREKYETILAISWINPVDRLWWRGQH